MRQIGSRHRRTITIAVVAVTVGIACVTAIAVVLASVKPRGVTVNEAANINPLPTTICISDADIYGMSPADVNRTLNAMKSTQVNTVRILMPWAGVEPL